MNTILFVFTMVAAPSPVTQFYEWRMLTETKSLAKCEQIAKELNLSKEKYRCVKL
ncbi:MAG: hypothetical protein RL463_1010 [Bacteroidota bacterium]|jgi:hypothetical protein